MSEVAARGLGKAHVRVTGSGFSEDSGRQETGLHRGLRAADQGLTPDFLMSVAAVFDEAEDILIGRQKDYGPGNINGGYPTPLIALVTRMNDKLERIKHILKGESEAVYGVGMWDSW